MDYTGMAKKSHEADIVIDSTMNVDDIAETLHENGIIEMPWLFKTYINMNDEAEGFLDGEYTVQFHHVLQQHYNIAENCSSVHKHRYCNDSRGLQRAADRSAS